MKTSTIVRIYKSPEIGAKNTRIGEAKGFRRFCNSYGRYGKQPALWVRESDLTAAWRHLDRLHRAIRYANASDQTTADGMFQDAAAKYINALLWGDPRDCVKRDIRKFRNC